MSWGNVKKILGTYVTCTTCRGTGSIIKNNKIITCPTCNGEGVIKKKTT